MPARTRKKCAGIRTLIFLLILLRKFCNTVTCPVAAVAWGFWGCFLLQFFLCAFVTGLGVSYKAGIFA